MLLSLFHFLSNRLKRWHENWLGLFSTRCVHLPHWVLSWLRRLPANLRRRRPEDPPFSRYGRRKEPSTSPVRVRAKPAWIRQEIITLAARAPELGCRSLRHIFNRRHEGRHSVGHDFVWRVLRDHQAEIRLQRRQLKQRTYCSGKHNRVWGMDGTGKTDETGNTHFLLGIVDHGTRRCIDLKALPDKATITLLRNLLDAIERHGKPRRIRTDNEVIFNNPLFDFVLHQLGIEHQTIERHCPWQNGRIERFFGTLKQKLDCWAVPDRISLNASLAQFITWYNHVRPHQHLQGMTPMEVWSGIHIQRRAVMRRVWFEAWDGLLQGEYLQR